MNKRIGGACKKIANILASVAGEEIRKECKW